MEMGLGQTSLIIVISIQQENKRYPLYMCISPFLPSPL